jgi:putative ABC transport system permease protein
MRAAWQLAISSLSGGKGGRRGRTALLIAATALSTALIAAVACAIGAVNLAIQTQIEASVGAADLRIKPPGSGLTMPAEVLDRVREWPEVEIAEARSQTSLAVRYELEILEPDPSAAGAYRNGVLRISASPIAESVVTKFVAPPATGGPSTRHPAPPPKVLAGRLPREPSEIAINTLLADQLSWTRANDPEKRDGFIPPLLRPSFDPVAVARDVPALLPASPTSVEQARTINASRRVMIGDRLTVVERAKFMGQALPELLSISKESRTLTIVGITEPLPLEGRPTAFLTLEGVSQMSGEPGRIGEILITLRAGHNAGERVAERKSNLDAIARDLKFPQLILESTAKVTSGLEQNIASGQLGFVLAVVMSSLSAAFIILTGMSTSLGERLRELGILRSIGATRGQLALSQLFIGLIIGLAGAAIGLPVGIVIAKSVGWFFRAQLTWGIPTPPLTLTLAALGAVLSGLLGALWPAWKSARISPLGAIASRAALPSSRAIGILTAIGLAGVLIQAAIIALPRDGQFVFWAYSSVGLPAMFIGYFLLSVAVTLLIARALAPVISRLLRLPPNLLQQSIAATPYRHGFTAGALMTGLAMLVSIWTSGGAILRDWLGRIEFPDAFVAGPNLGQDALTRLQSLTGIVDKTCPISLHFVETDIFGVRALQQYKTTFIAFEPAPFFAMTTLKWVQGDQATAQARLEQGGGVLIAREFQVARGMGVGDRFKATHEGRSIDFEIVGVVTSPGLEIVSKFFNVGETYADQAVHAVFGSRRDLVEHFKTDAVQMVQIDLADGVDDAVAVPKIREAMRGIGVLDVGSGRAIKREIEFFAGTMLLIFSLIAIMAMAVASLGVANLIIAAIQARRFEFGVLRAIGASQATLIRLVLAEVLIITLAASILGVALGMQGSWAGQRLYGDLLGLEISIRPPWGPIVWGSLALTLIALIAAAPAILNLNRARPRELLASVRG